MSDPFADQDAMRMVAIINHCRNLYEASDPEYFETVGSFAKSLNVSFEHLRKVIEGG